MLNNSSTARVLLKTITARVFRAAGKWLGAFVLVSVTAGFSSCSGNVPIATSYTVSGTVVGPGWGGSVVLQLNGGDNTTIVLPPSGVSAPFTFSTALPIGTPYAVTVLQAPPYSPCAPLLNGVFESAWTGPGTADVTNVLIHCNGVLTGVGATVSGLLPNQSVTVQTTATQPPGVQGWPGTATGTATTNGPCNQCEANGIPGFSYTVAIVSQPAGETCTGDQQGTVGLQNITVAIVCTPSSFTIGGTVSGLSAGNSVVLQDNGGNATTVSANGPFTFSTKIAYQSPYAVTVATQPTGQSCSVTNGSGTVPAANVTNVTIVCTAASYTIGGAVSGLSAGNSVVLEDNGGNATTVSANGPFTFSTAVAYQSPYTVTIATQPNGQSCSVNNGSGTVPGANVTNVAVMCTTTADAGLWTWESGSNTPDFIGVYGILGTAAPGNTPGGREAGFSWTDSAGNLWMFGGIGAGNSGVGGSFNDLWRYNLSTGLWAWMAGAETLDALSVYGTKGTAAAGNVPSAREGGASWTDPAGNLWLFGGGGFDSTGSNGALNDLWQYNPSTGLWAWMSGPTTGNAAGIYGTLGTAAPGNLPGARSAVVYWKDAAGNFWLFGGAGFDSVDSDGYLNDLWRYSASSGMWTWMGGSTAGNAPGVYGTQGTAAAANVPGARAGAVSWTDGSGNFWLFGGRGHDSTGAIGELNDLWRYSPSTSQWTWMNGSNLQGAAAVYGTLGTAAAGNVPGARQDAASWIDSAGNLWLFGNGVFDSNGNLLSVGNDLWRYAPSTGLWTWIGGSATQGAPGVYGTEGTAAPGNVPGGRDIAASWSDGAGNFWLFGGYVPADALNDLWKYVPPVP
jgi:Kelch motif/Galactose oxidase, central domain